MPITVKLPNGQTASFPDGMNPVDIQKAIESDPQFAPKPVGERMLQAGENFLSGVGGGAIGLMNTGSEWAQKHLPSFLTRSDFGFGKPVDEAAFRSKYVEPHSTAERIGNAAEKATEFLIPGNAEESGAAKLADLAPKLGKAAKPAARLLTSAAGAGLVNKAQGGSLLTGAAVGAGGSLIGEAARASAPTLVGIAQGLKPQDFRGTGKAILEETRGVVPGQIRSSARGVLDKLNPELNRVAEKSPALIPMASAREAASEQVGHAIGQNEPKLISGTKRMGRQLFTKKFEPPLGAEGPTATLPIPDEVPAAQYLELKRGVGNALPAGSWSPESANSFKGPRNAIYGTMAKEFEKHVPEAAPLNQRISTLIPATKGPKNFFFGHALGPGVGATLGGVGGWRREGIPGAVAGALEGGLAGFAFPSAMNSVARLSYSPGARRLLVPLATGSLLQGTRGQKP